MKLCLNHHELKMIEAQGTPARPGFCEKILNLPDFPKLELLQLPPRRVPQYILHLKFTIILKVVNRIFDSQPESDQNYPLHGRNNETSIQFQLGMLIVWNFILVERMI